MIFRMYRKRLTSIFFGGRTRTNFFGLEFRLRGSFKTNLRREIISRFMAAEALSRKRTRKKKHSRKDSHRVVCFWLVVSHSEQLLYNRSWQIKRYPGFGHTKIQIKNFQLWWNPTKSCGDSDKHSDLQTLAIFEPVSQQGTWRGILTVCSSNYRAELWIGITTFGKLVEFPVSVSIYNLAHEIPEMIMPVCTYTQGWAKSVWFKKNDCNKQHCICSFLHQVHHLDAQAHPSYRTS